MKSIFAAAAIAILTTSCGGNAISSPDAFCELYKPVRLTDPEIAVLGRESKERIALNNRQWLRRCR